MEDSCRRSLTGFQEHHPGLALLLNHLAHRAAHPVLPYQKWRKLGGGEVMDRNLARALLAPSLSQKRLETRGSLPAPIPHNHSSPPAHLRDVRKDRAVASPTRPRAPTRERNQDFQRRIGIRSKLAICTTVGKSRVTLHSTLPGVNRFAMAACRPVGRENASCCFCFLVFSLPAVFGQRRDTGADVAGVALRAGWLWRIGSQRRCG